MKSKIIAAYLLGITMGIIILFFLYVLYIPQNQKTVSTVTKIDESVQDNTSMQIKVLEQQNSRLKKQVEDLKLDNASNQAPVKLIIENDMNNSDIAKMLVSSGIYPYENDLLLILEILGFDKEKASTELENIGIVDSADAQLRAYTVYENKREQITNQLIKSKLIQDQKSFEKFIYIFKDSTNVKPGEKVFEKNISLREIVDILVN